MNEPTGPRPSAAAPLLEISNLTVEYLQDRRSRAFRAADGVDLRINANETVGLVGESGSGKSTIGRAILGLAPVTSGTITFDGADITRATRAERRKLSAGLQVIFQDPFSSLNPTRTIGQTLAEMFRPHRNVPAAEVPARVRAALERVGLPAEAANRYPSQFSGGQRQRIAIARALMVQPRLVICDEPVSAVDISVQAQVLNLLHELQVDLGVSYLFIAHDLAVVKHLSHRIVVLYRARVMEEGPADAVYNNPVHPYTQVLRAAALPDPERQRARRKDLPSRRMDAGESLPDDSCFFAPRCPHVIDICRSVRPQLEDTPDGSRVACHRWRDLRADATGAASGGLQVRDVAVDAPTRLSGDGSSNRRGTAVNACGAAAVGLGSRPAAASTLTLSAGEQGVGW